MLFFLMKFSVDRAAEMRCLLFLTLKKVARLNNYHLLDPLEF